MLLTTILAWSSGLRFIAPDLEPTTLFGTALAIHLTNAVVCRVLAHQNGRRRSLWTLLGLTGGLWAVAVLILLPQRGGEPSPPPRPLP